MNKATKTNKSYTKRLKETSNGKLVGRSRGQSHFRSRKTGRQKTHKRSMVSYDLKKKLREIFLSK